MTMDTNFNKLGIQTLAQKVWWSTWKDWLSGQISNRYAKVRRVENEEAYLGVEAPERREEYGA